MQRCEVAVVGAGLVGSAAGAYLAQDLGPGVCLIGPDEPAEGSPARAHTVYASHYDAGRIQRLTGKDATWTRLNLEAAQAYPALEAETGLRFHATVGCLYVSPHGPDDYLRQAPALAAEAGVAAQYLPDAAALAEAVPAYRFAGTPVGWLEAAPAGVIYPRALAAAQQARMRARGGKLLRATVLGAQPADGGYRLRLAEGEPDVWARRVLLATGAFTNMAGVLPRPLAMTLKGELTVLAEVDAPTADRLAHLPALLYEGYFADRDGIYLTGPLRYPDGRYYVKMGMNVPEDPYFTTLPQVQAWMASLATSSPLLPRLRAQVEALLPGVAFLSWQLRHCIIHRTPSLRPVIAQAAPGLAVAAGCNGYSAMCADALGRLAAHQCLHGSLPPGWDAAWFAADWA